MIVGIGYNSHTAQDLVNAQSITVPLLDSVFLDQGSQDSQSTHVVWIEFHRGVVLRHGSLSVSGSHGLH